MIRVLMSRLLDGFLRRPREARLDEEIRSHIDLLAADYAARGLPETDARDAALRAFGGVEQIKEAYRDQRGLPVVDALAQDVRFALRLLRRYPGFTVTAVLVLGIGIGVNNMFFTILNAHTIRGLPLRDAGRVVYVSGFDDRTPDLRMSFADFADIRGAAAGVVNLGAFLGRPIVLSGDGRSAERLEAAYVSEDTFEILGIPPVLGRDFSAADHRPGAAAVALIGSGAWTSLFGGDASVTGRPVLINGVPATIVGVIPERAGFPSTAEIWMPLAQVPGFEPEARGARSLGVFGRVREGSSVAEAGALIASVADRLSRDHPETNRNVRARVVPINERFLGSLTHPAWRAFMMAGILVVLISCANAANLLLSRSAHRAREIAIRTSLGASRRRVLRQLLIEGAVLAAAGGATGLAVGMLGVRVFRSAIPENVLPYWLDYSVDWRVVAALVLVSACSVFVFALLPAIRASKSDVNRVLKEGGGGTTTGRGTQRWATVFLAAEFGLAFVLLSQLALGLRSTRPEVPSDDAIDTRQVLTAALTLPDEAYPSPDRRWDFHARLHERLRAHPGIADVSMASALPVNGAPDQELAVEGRPRNPGDPATTVQTVLIGPRYFETLGLTLAAGRGFTAADGSPGQAHAIVNERLARQIFGDASPLGRRIAINATAPQGKAPEWLTIVGVGPDVRQRPVLDAGPIVYVPFRSSAPATGSLLVRSSAESAVDLTNTVRTEVHALDSNLPLYRVRTLAQAVRDATWNGRVSARLILAITFIAVALSALGLYAVTMYGVSQRTHEIGLRVALGARPSNIAATIVRRAFVQLAAGFGAGILLTMLWDRMFMGPSPGSRAADPGSLLLVAATLVILAALACAVPVRRAIRLDPRTAMERQG